MDTLSPNNCSKSSSSGNSANSSSMDLGEKQSKQRQREQKLSRSRSLLQLLSKHLGRHFQHHHHQNDAVYSSQDDIRSSSTDSFSLSYERGSHNECLEEDMENTSRTSSASYSPGMEFYDNSTHIYVETVYRPGSAMEQLHPHYDDSRSSSSNNSSSSRSSVDGEDQVDENENEHLKPHNEPHPRSASAASAASATGTSKAGLHLSRISISSSVSRMLQHFSTSAATTATASLRSLSCSNTPLRQLRTQRDVTSATMTKKSLMAHNSSNSNCSSSNSNSNSKSNSNSSSNSSNSSGSRSRCRSSSKSNKKDKKQQSILRPPVQYVYMKGMSGLYSRVPSYAVCCPYTVQHMY